jgi:hypothetical protein
MHTYSKVIYYNLTVYYKSRFFQTKAMLYLNVKITVQTQALNIIGVNDLLQNSLLRNTFNYVSSLYFLYFDEGL